MSKALAAIKKAIKQQEIPPEQITDLDLNGVQIGQFTPEIKSIIQTCKNLESLNLSQCDISSLKNLPNLKKLNDLDLSTNSLPDSELKQLGIYKALTALSIADNKIQKIETLKQLKGLLPDIERLECADNSIETLPNYFKSVFELFPKLQSLDNKDKQGNEMNGYEFQDEEQLEQDEEGLEKNGDQDSDDQEIDQDQSYDAEQDGQEDSP